MIETLIAQGESKRLEFKRTLPKGHQIAKTVCAFANRAGGKLIIGIEDGGHIIGIGDNQVQEYLEKLPNIIHDTISPMVLPEIYTYYIEGKTIIVIEVFPGNTTPYYLKTEGKQRGTYVRVGSTNKQADLELLQDLERRRLNISFDMDTYAEVDEATALQLMTVVNEQFSDPVTIANLHMLGLLQTIGQKDYLTNGGAILLGILENSKIRCARFIGDNSMSFLDQKVYEGHLFEQIISATNFIISHLNVSGRFESGNIHRIDELEMPYNIVREAVINAILHRDYGISGSDIKIAIYNNRIEIISPGGLPRTITVDELYAGRSEIRNKVLAKVLLRAKLIEQWGSGIPRIREASRALGYRLPEITEDGLFVRLIIYRGQSTRQERIKETTGRYGTEHISDREDNQRKLLDLVKNNPEITVKALANATGMTLSTIQRRLAKLQSKGQLKRIGSKKTGYWKV